MPEDVAPRPSDLASALRALAARLSPRGMQIDCRIPALEVLLPPAMVSTCVRICEEAVRNALHHARARHITIELQAREDRVVARVLDDGIGFDHTALEGHGILRMNELARSAGGRLDLRSAPHAGTCVSMHFQAAA